MEKRLAVSPYPPAQSTGTLARLGIFFLPTFPQGPPPPPPGWWFEQRGGGVRFLSKVYYKDIKGARKGDAQRCVLVIFAFEDL